jgi:hypothetical protein
VIRGDERATVVVMSNEVKKRTPRTVVRQVRLSPEVFRVVKTRCDELNIPIARYLALAVARSLGPQEGMDALFKDLSQLRGIQDALG